MVKKTSGWGTFALLFASGAVLVLGSVLLILLAETAFNNKILQTYNLHYQPFLFCYVFAMLLTGNIAVSVVVCKKNSNGAACWYGMWKFLFLFSFIVFGASVIAGNAYIERRIESYCDGSQDSKIDLLYEIVEDHICTKSCPCKAEEEEWEDQGYSIHTDEDGVESAIDCKGFSDEVKKQNLEAYVIYATFFEEYLDCTSMCTKSPFFGFSAVGNGVPDMNCLDRLENYIEKYYPYLVAFGFTFAALMLLGVVGSCMSCDYSDNSYDQIQKKAEKSKKERERREREAESD